ncbi:hypothetical protein [Actinokineospora xionganensis]|uniref:Uncharacterized protein n=1 Tax=Actinokineospora xionganensis TaxID=2684470 RepID=A0ABR7L8R4_9PSEU|nr:hypothetical protein [Actinokineospora xionganensis]MBC6449095.1 hypothetical protein [Actinokineospora xionganensis]
MSQPPSYPPGQGYGQDNWDTPEQQGWQGSPAPQPYPQHPYTQQPYPQAPPYSEHQAYPQQALPPDPKPNTAAFGKAFAAAGISVLVLFGLLMAAFGFPDSGGSAGESVGRLVGRMSVLVGMAGGVVGLIAKNSRKLWPSWQYYLLTVPAVLILLVMTTAGSLSRT